MTTRTQDNYYPRPLVPRTTRTQDDSYPGQLVPKTTHSQHKSYQGQLVSRTSRNYSQIMTILSKTFPLLVIFVTAATTIYALTLLNEFIMRKKMQVPVLSAIKHGSWVSYQVLACQFSSNREVWFIGG